MDINGWLTVVSILTAIFALVPKEDLKLSFLNISKVERNSILIIVLILIPYLIIFPKLVFRFPILDKICWARGFEPENIAFALFYLSFLWLILRLFWLKPKLKATKKLIEYYIELLNCKSFVDFFQLFKKYTNGTTIKNEWSEYRNVIFNPKFLNGLIKKEPAYLLQFWDKFLNKKDFKTVFLLFLENEKSTYYKEIRELGSSYYIEDKPFLNKILREYIVQSVQNDLLVIFSDFVTRHLKKEEEKQSIYNQEYYSKRLKDEDGFDLPVYYHILFVGVMHSIAIQDKIKIANIPTFKIYSSMISCMIDNINIEVVDLKQRYSTNYHWLISQIFSENENWLSTFIEEDNYSCTSDYTRFIPISFDLCLKELYRGFKEQKISHEFVREILHNKILDYYFGFAMNEEMKSKIEEYVINNIPDELLKPILDYSLNLNFAISFDEFFELAAENEQDILLRLWNFLREKGKV